ncbi:Sin-like protein conserved region-domain-containing protein [Phlyctochytrium arcticum]|nr:Sin-like protein conserved region-domain-containing protein [Phlyctochytrium arcticum]
MDDHDFVIDKLGVEAMDVFGDDAALLDPAFPDQTPQVSATEDEDEEEDDDDDGQEQDEVVKEVTVYFSQSLANHLHLFQYPTRPHPFDADSHPTAGRVKPLTQRYELDIPLQTNSSFYNRDRGEELGQGTDNRAMRGVNDFEEDTTAPAKLLDKQVLSSSLQPTQAKFMVGIIRNDELHLNAVSSTLQLRPSLYYIDKIVEKRAKRYEEDSLEANKRDNPAYEEEAKVLSVQVKGPEDKEALRKAAQAELLRKSEEEPWLSMRIYNPSDPACEELIDRMISTSTTPVAFNESSHHYLDTIHPAVADIKAEQALDAQKGLSLRKVSQLPLEDKLKSVLMNAHVVQFSTIAEYLGGEHGQEEILQKLAAVAVLVRGVWVVRSELMYTGICLAARRWLLHMFQRSRYVSRSDFGSATRLPGPMATHMLSEIAFLEGGQGWTLKVQPDESFLGLYKEVVHTQAGIVQEEAEMARDEVLYPDHRREAGGQQHMLGSIGKGKGKAQGVGKATRNGTSASAAAGAGGAGHTLKDQLTHFLTQLLDVHGVLSEPYILSAVASRGAESGLAENLLATASRSDVHTLIAQHCTEVKPGCWVRNRDDPVRKCVIELFGKQGVVVKKDVADAVLAKYGDKVTMTTTTYTKLMREIGVVKQGTGKWELKSPPIWQS